VIEPPELTPDVIVTNPKKLDRLFKRGIIFDALNDNTNDWSVGDFDGEWWVGTRLIEKGF
jgi:hypothetical protein